MIPAFLHEKNNERLVRQNAKQRLLFVDKTLHNLAKVIYSTFVQWYFFEKKGFLQRLDSRVKVLFLFSNVLIISLIHSSLLFLLLLAFFSFAAYFSKINVISIYSKALLAGFIFGFLVFLPATLNIFTKGTPLVTLFHFNDSYSFWIYKIPQEISITYEGILALVRFTLRIINSIFLILLVLYSTSFDNILKALAYFKIPSLFLLTILMTYKLILIFSQKTQETMLALKMRWWNTGNSNDIREIIGGRFGYIFQLAYKQYEQTYYAMLARGFNHSPRFVFFDKLSRENKVFVCVILMIDLLIFLTDKYIYHV